MSSTSPTRPAKLIFPAAECNKQVILDVLVNEIIPDSTTVSILEIGSGSGQHAVHFASYFPLATFQPSDIDPNYLKSIQAHIDEYDVNAFTKNVLSPIVVDLLAPINLPKDSFDFVYCCNLIHVTPIECSRRLFAWAGHVLKGGGGLITYGPYALAGDGRITPESNRRFHAHLQRENPEWGLKGIDQLADIAEEYQIRLKRQFNMPENNKILWWQKDAFV